MRPGNLPGGGHDKVTWKRSRDLLKRRCDNVSLRRGGDVPQWRYWMFHLGLTGDVVGTYWWDVVDMYHWDVLVAYQWDVVGCFIWNLFEMLWRRTDETSLLRPLETSSRHSNKMSWIRTSETSWRSSIETSLGVSFETYLRCRWDVQRDVVTTLPRRLFAGWGNSVSPKCILYENANKVLGSCSFVFKICSYHIKIVLTHQVNMNLKQY